MKENLVKYLAGLLDADGSLSFSFKKYEKAEDVFFLGLQMRLAASDAIDHHGFVASLPEETGMGGISRYGKDKQYITWTVSKRSDLEMLLPRLIKHMVIKGKHWKWLLEKWREQRSVWLSSKDREQLTASSKVSRIENAGPAKPKNHPTWAWLAGYLDGDGWYRLKYQKPPHNYWQINVGAVAHANDMGVLKFLRNAFGGNVFKHDQSPDVMIWRRNLGVKDADFALRFLSKVTRHARLKKHKIDQIIHFHRQQRLSVPTPAGEATV